MSVVPRVDWPPSWNTLPHGIGVGRYIDPAFQRLEYERLWSRVWQVAARVDEIPEINDYTVYEIGRPAAAKPQRASVQQVTNFSDPGQLLLIPRQDLANIPRIQKGVHSRGMQHTWLSGNQEKLILNMHEELDRYLQPECHWE